MPIDPLLQNSLVPNPGIAGTAGPQVGSRPLAATASGLPAATSLTGGPASVPTFPAPFGVGAPASGALPGANPQLQNMLPQILTLMTSMLQLIQGGGLSAAGGAAAPAAVGGAAPAAGAANGQPLQADQSVIERTNSILQQGLDSISGIGSGQAREAIQNGMGNVIGQVDVNGVAANLNFSVNDLRDTLSYSRSLGLTAQNGRIDQAQLQGAIARAESSGAPPNVVATLRSLNDNWGVGEQLGIIQGGALTSGGVDTLMGILRNRAEGAAAEQGGIAARVGGRAVTNVFNTIEQPVRGLIRDTLGL